MKSIINILVSVVFCCSFLVHAQSAGYEDLNWLNLLPERDRLALMSLGPIDHGDGDVGGRQPALGAGRANFSEEDLVNVWYSVDIVPEYDGRKVRVPGFVVPLEYNEAQQVTEFFLVPYFGACIHMPPPPPNQIIHITMQGGFNLRSIYEPYVVEGEMQITTTYRDIGISAYSLSADRVVLYGR
jgi:hypothetical protein